MLRPLSLTEGQKGADSCLGFLSQGVSMCSTALCAVSLENRFDRASQVVLGFGGFHLTPFQNMQFYSYGCEGSPGFGSDPALSGWGDGCSVMASVGEVPLRRRLCSARPQCSAHSVFVTLSALIATEPCLPQEPALLSGATRELWLCQVGGGWRTGPSCCSMQGACSGTCLVVPHVPRRTSGMLLGLLLAGAEHGGFSWSAVSVEGFSVTSRVK